MAGSQGAGRQRRAGGRVKGGVVGGTGTGVAAGEPGTVPAAPTGIGGPSSPSGYGAEHFGTDPRERRRKRFFSRHS